jgi:hypothetical protein
VGENPADNEGIGDLEYFPATSGFSKEYFPYLNQASDYFKFSLNGLLLKSDSQKKNSFT